jgi:D-alanine transaminase
MENLGYYNGRYAPLEEMTVPMNDRACYFGDGIFEVAYCRNYKIYSLDEHMDRLYESAKILGIDIPHTKEELSDIIKELVLLLDSHEQLVCWQVSRGTQLRNHAPAEGLKANVWITLRPMKIKDIYTPMTLISLEDTRFLHCNMKTLNLIPTVIASAKAEAAGADEAVFHRDGRVTECAHSNISIIKDGAVKTAPADNMILAGVARAHLIKVCREFGIPVYEEPYTLDELMAADEVIVTSSGTLCRPVKSVDGIPVGGKAPQLLRRLQDELMRDYLDKTE